MKIGLDVRPLLNRTSGIGKHLAYLLPELCSPEKLLNHEYCLYSDEPIDESYDQKFIVRKHRWKALNYKQIWTNLVIRPELINGQLDLYHTFTNIDFPFTNQFKKIVTVHDLIPYLFPHYTSPLFASSFRFFVKRIRTHCDQVIAVSPNTKYDLIEHLKIDERKISVIPNGIAPIYTFPTSPSHTTVGKYLPYDSNLKYFLIVGSLAPHKNIPFLVKILESLPAPDARYVFIGITNRAQINILKRLVSASRLKDKVHITGFVEEADMPAFYHCSRALLFPSLYEGFGFPPYEALACGCEVALMDTKYASEIHPDSAIKLNQSADDWYNAILQLYFSENDKDTRETTSLAVRKKFCWKKVANMTRNVYDRCSTC